MLPKMNNKLFGPTLLLIAQYTNRIIGPLVSILVVRYLEPEQYGLYASAISVTLLLTFIPNFGIQQGVINFFSQSKSDLNDILKNALISSLLYTIVACAIVIAWFSIIDYHVTTKLIGIMMTITYVRIALLTVVTAGLQALGKYKKIAFWNLGINSAYWISTLILMVFDADIYQLSIYPVVLTTLLSLIMFVFEWKKFKLLRPKLQKRNLHLSEFIKGTFPFGLSISMYELYHRSDALILSVTRAPIEVGFYTLSFKIIELINLFPGIIFNQVLFLKFFQWNNENSSKIKTYFSFLNKILFSLSAIILIVVFFYGEKLIYFVFGTEQLSSLKYLILMAWVIPIRYLLSSLSTVLVTGGGIKTKLKIESVIAFINILLNITFVPQYGGIAAALIMVFTELLLLVCFAIYVNKKVIKFKISSIDILYILIIIFIILFDISVVARLQYLKLFGGIFTLIFIIFTSYKWLTSKELIELTSLICNPKRKVQSN